MQPIVTFPPRTGGYDHECVAALPAGIELHAGGVLWLPTDITVEEMLDAYDGNTIELHHGAVVVNPAGRDDDLVGQATRWLRDRGLRATWCPVVLGERMLLRPDVGVIDNSAGHSGRRSVHADACRLVVEVVADWRHDWRVDAYLGAGVGAVWRLDPSSHSIRTYGTFDDAVPDDLVRHLWPTPEPSEVLHG